MLNDDLNRGDLNRDNLTSADRRAGMGGGLIGLIVAAAVIAVLFVWARHDRRLFHNAACGSCGADCTRAGACCSRCTVHNPVTIKKNRWDHQRFFPYLRSLICFFSSSIKC